MHPDRRPRTGVPDIEGLILPVLYRIGDARIERAACSSPLICRKNLRMWTPFSAQHPLEVVDLLIALFDCALGNSLWTFVTSTSS